MSGEADPRQDVQEDMREDLELADADAESITGGDTANATPPPKTEGSTEKELWNWRKL